MNKSKIDEGDGNGDDNSGRANDHDRGNGETATPQTSTFEEYGVSFCYRFFIDNRTQLNLTLFFCPFFGYRVFRKKRPSSKTIGKHCASLIQKIVCVVGPQFVVASQCVRRNFRPLRLFTRRDDRTLHEHQQVLLGFLVAS